MQDTQAVKTRQPCLYNDKVEPFLEQIKIWAASGMTEYEICAVLGISLSSWKMFKFKHENLKAVLSLSWDEVVERAEQSLADRSNGIQFVEITEEMVTVGYEGVIGEDGKKVMNAKGKALRIPIREMVETKRVTKLIPPDVPALKYLLGNRKPARWKERIHDEKSGHIIHYHIPTVNKPDDAGISLPLDTPQPEHDPRNFTG